MEHQRLPAHYLSGMGGIAGIAGMTGMAGMAGMAGMKRDGKVGNLKLDLPVDEDDYLMPSPQSTQTNGGYMDLIGDSKPAGSQPEAGRDFVRSLPAIKRVTGCNGLPPPLSMDNPEYHMMNQDVHTLYNPSSPSYLSQKSPLSQLPVLPVGGGASLGIPVNGLGIGIMAGINTVNPGSCP